MTISRREFIKHLLLLGGAVYCNPPPLWAAKPKLTPAYANLARKGELADRSASAYAVFQECRLCPRECGVNRLKGEQGFCRAPAKVMVYSAQPHYGEELSLVGAAGSGTIFFSNCNLRCVFCQNWPIAHEGRGKVIEDHQLADIMLKLQQIGCSNINLVTPTHVMPNILNAVRLALAKGLHLPLVYNTSGYERVEMLQLLDGIIDIYLPDMKFMNDEKAATYLGGASDYPEASQKAVLEMARQVGDHQTDQRGTATRGVMIRHLVMPNNVAGTDHFVRWVAMNLPPATYVNIMSQYRVDYKAFEYPQIWRRITMREYVQAMEWAQASGLTNLDPKSVEAWRFYKQTLRNEPS